MYYGFNDLNVFDRFDRLISQNVSVQIESDSYLQTKEESLNWLHRLTSSNVLGSLFIINQVNNDLWYEITYDDNIIISKRYFYYFIQIDDKKINNLRHSFERYENKTVTTSFICILSKGEHICNELKSTGISALNISWDGLPSKSKSITKILSSFDLLLQTSNTVSSSSFLYSEKDSNIPHCNYLY